jgi:protein involved in polysaccharide export with SLBB domain
MSLRDPTNKFYSPRKTINTPMKTIPALLICVILGCAVVGADQPKIQVGDVLELSLMKMPKGEVDLWNGNYSVNEGGKIKLPLLGQFKISGMTLNEAASAIEKALRERAIYNNPDLDLKFPKAALERPKEDKNKG